MEITATNKEKYIFEDKEVGNGGQGCVYRGKGEFERYIFKRCKFTSYRELKTLLNEFRQLDDYVKEYFLEPIVLVNDTDTGFVGYIMEHLTEYQEIDKWLEGFQENNDETNWMDWYNKRCLKNRLLIAYNIAKAFALLHDKRKIYRDISPYNIWIDSTLNGCAVKIIDIDNISRPRTSSRVIGTLGYGAPEIYISTTCADFYSDDFSLGVLLFRFLMGKSFPCCGDLINNEPPEELDKALKGLYPYVLEDKEEKGTSRDEAERLSKIANALLTRKLQNLFKKMFINSANNTDKRPRAKEFADACFEASNQVLTCPECQRQFIVDIDDDNNVYPDTCPWCEEKISEINMIEFYDKYIFARAQRYDSEGPHKSYKEDRKYIYVMNKNEKIEIPKYYIDNSFITFKDKFGSKLELGYNTTIKILNGNIKTYSGNNGWVTKIRNNELDFNTKYMDKEFTVAQQEFTFENGVPTNWDGQSFRYFIIRKKFLSEVS